MNIDICIPAYNEEKIIESAIYKVAAVLETVPGAHWRIIVADNGSSDLTGQRAAAAGAIVFSTPQPGKGLAVIGAAARSDAEIFGFIDADLSADPSDIVTLLRQLSAGADIAIGSRLLGGHIRRGFLRSLSSKIFNGVRYVLLGIKVSDTQCGLKLMNAKGREILARCKEQGWFFDIEFLALAERSQLHIREIPIRWDEFRFAGRRSKLNVLVDGIRGLKAMLRIRSRIHSIAYAVK